MVAWRWRCEWRVWLWSRDGCSRGEAVCEQPMVTGRTRAMAIATTRDALGRIADADLARAYPYLVCTRVGDNEILRHTRNHYGLGEATQGDENGAGKRASVAS